MNVLVCLDVDGTLDSGESMPDTFKGCIDVNKLYDKMLCDESMGIYVVSESPYYPKNKDGEPLFERCVGVANNREMNLVDARSKYSYQCGENIDLRLYVSDNGDIAVAKNAKFIYVTPELFADMYGVKKDG